jgi:hypothetical protein
LVNLPELRFSVARFSRLGVGQNRSSQSWRGAGSADGALQGLGEIEHQFDIDKDRAGEFPAGEGGIILIARLLGLLLIFLGEP